MPRFTRFVALSSALLFLLYLFYPFSTESVAEHITTENVLSKNKAVPVSQSAELVTTIGQNKLPKDSQQQPLSKTPLTLREQLATVFPYDLNSVFPSFIWQTWKTTPSDPDFEFREAEASWTERHTGYIHEVITDQVAALLVKHLYSSVPQVVEAYDALPKAILKADFFRYLILLARGGVYSDIDTQVIRPVWEWVPDALALEHYGLVIGIEADPDREDWAEWYSRRMQFCQWTIRSKVGHPVLAEVVARLTEKTLEMKASKSLETNGLKSIVEWTGPAMWTDAIFDYLNTNPTRAFEPARETNVSWRNLTGMTEAKRLSDIVILPITGFSPGQGHMGSLNFDDPHAMVKHDFEGSWKPESERMHDEEHGWIVSQG